MNSMFKNKSANKSNCYIHRIYILIGILFMLAFFSCSKNTRTTNKGYVFNVLRQGNGKVVQAKEFLLMNMEFSDGNDSVWYNSRDKGIPTAILIRADSLKDEEEGVSEIFRMLSKGDSVSFKIPAKILFEKTWRQPLPPMVDSTSEFTFHIGVRDIMDSIQMVAFRKEITEQQENSRKEAQQEQVEKDIAIIDQHLIEKGITAEKTESGLRYQIIKEGVGEVVEPGQKMSVYYAGYMLDGTLFDTNIETVAKAQKTYTEGRPYNVFTLTVGQGQVIEGWEEMLMLMKKGEKVRVWIPSSLAYGPQKRSKIIVENSILVFDIEAVDMPK